MFSRVYTNNSEKITAAISKGCYFNATDVMNTTIHSLCPVGHTFYVLQLIGHVR